ncbi:signal transduction histidine kinase [Paenibacillus forsythiae]|uniref:histidine kinase n=1 Tax=Paenibacillus forsythiae TaxID=365616 RepID=A0ABU3H4K5_9BACL|nr:HAMP domain-containing sensor histidine kinase [Paenibacillus forsythiae]MDT3425759.1 signal transduction histidine kinase [Paenibacillus forsythiae]
MKNNVIGLKLGLVISGLVLVVLLFLGVAVDRMFTSFYSANMKTETEELASHFTVMAESSEEDTGKMMGTFAEFSAVTIYNVRRDGSVIKHSGVQDPAYLSFIRPLEVGRIFASQKVNFFYEDPAGGRYFVAGQPIVRDGKVASALYILASTETMDRSLAGVRNLLVLSGVGAFLLALGSTWIIAQFLSRPLLQMQKATRKIAAGELETRVDIRSRDEIGALAGAINDLAVDLQHYRDTRQEFFANISHELRTPITYLEGYANVLKDRLYATEEEKDQYLGIIYMEARRIQHLVDDLFELAKMEEGKITLAPEWIDLAELMEQAVNKARLKAADKALKLEYTAEGAPQWMYTDGARMEQIVLNLLENAIRYTEKGTVSMRLSFEAGGVKLAVRDTGIGIPEDELPFIFERFYRVEKSRSRMHGGTGLGLSIVHKLTGLLGGAITVASRPGEGTCFELYFDLRLRPGKDRV